jgi:hypothetical protein
LLKAGADPEKENPSELLSRNNSRDAQVEVSATDGATVEDTNLSWGDTPQQGQMRGVQTRTLEELDLESVVKCANRGQRGASYSGPYQIGTAGSGTAGRTKGGYPVDDDNLIQILNGLSPALTSKNRIVLRVEL